MQISSAFNTAAQGMAQAQVDLQKAADRMLSSTKDIMKGEAAPHNVDGGLRIRGPDGDLVSISKAAIDAWENQSLSDIFMDARMATYEFSGNTKALEAAQENSGTLMDTTA